MMPIPSAPRLGDSSSSTPVRVDLRVDDENLIRCPICKNIYSTQVFRCGNSHFLCLECYNSLPAIKTCPTPSCQNQNIARDAGFQRSLGELFIPCKNKPFGCQKFLSVVDRLTHETTDCDHQPFTCPYPHCDFYSSSSPGDLYTHFYSHQTEHAPIVRFDFGTPISFRRVPLDATGFFLQEAKEGVIFVFNQGIEKNERHFELQCIGSPILHGDAFRCSIEMKCVEINLFLSCTPTVCHQWVPRPPQNNFLIVPDASGTISMGTLVIKKGKPGRKDKLKERVKVERE